MDIERIKKLSESKVKAGSITKRVRTVLTDYEHTKQDVQEDLLETFKPIIEAQKETKETIDDNQNKMTEQLQKNQNKILPYYKQVQQLALPGPDGEQPPKIISDMNEKFTPEEFAIFQKHNLPLPSNVLIETLKNGKKVSEVLEKSGVTNRDLGREKGYLSLTKTAR